MKTLLFLTADFANLTQDNKVNILGMFNQIFASKYPAVHPQLAVVAKVGLEPGEQPKNRKLTIYLTGEDANTEQVKIFEETFNFPDRVGGLDPEHAVIINMRAMVFPKAGTYQLLLHIDDRFQGRTSLYLRTLEPQTPQLSE